MENIETSVNTETQVEETTPKTYTAEEVDRLIQAEADKRTNQALARQKKEYEKKLTLSQLDGDERAKAEKDNRIAELEEQLAAFQVERNKSEFKSVLASRGLSAEFIDIMNITEDVAAAQASIDKLDKLFKAAVKAEVERRMGGNAPKGATSADPITREQFRAMGVVAQNQLAATNRELYDKLSKS